MIIKAFWVISIGLMSFLFADTPSNVYYPRPTAPEEQYARIEIVVNDDFEQDGGIMKKVSFNKENLPLRTSDFTGQRGTFYYKVVPGRYSLKWTVFYKDRTPSTQSYERMIDATTPHRLIHITLQNDNSLIE